MADGQLGHVVSLLAQRDEVVVNASLILAGVVEIELLRLDVVFAQLLLLKLCNFLQEPLFLFHRHAPDDDDTVLVKEDFGNVHCSVEVCSHRSL